MSDEVQSGNLLGARDARMYRGLLMEAIEFADTGSRKGSQKKFPGAVERLTDFLTQRNVKPSKENMRQAAMEAGIVSGPVTVGTLRSMFERESNDEIPVTPGQEELRAGIAKACNSVSRCFLIDQFRSLCRYSAEIGRPVRSKNIWNISILVPDCDGKRRFINLRHLNSAIQGGYITHFPKGTDLKQVWEDEVVAHFEAESPSDPGLE